MVESKKVMCMIGSTGTGKSATANSLSGTNLYPTYAGAASCTYKTKVL